MKRMLAHRGGGHVVNEKQSLLFAETFSAVEPTPTSAPADPEPDDGGSDEIAASQVQPAKNKGAPRKPGKIDTAGLPSEDRVHDVPEDQRIDRATGKPLVRIGETVFEELNYQRAQLRVIRHLQPVYGLPPEAQRGGKVEPVMVDLPPRPLERCAASATLLAWLLVQKFANHLPQHRQEEIFDRDGRRLPKQALCGWALKSGEALRKRPTTA